MSEFLNQLNRRRFLWGTAGFGAAGLLAACGGGGTNGGSNSGGGTAGGASDSSGASGSSAATDSAAGGSDNLSGTISGLFMKQAGYSEDHINEMATAFTKLHPNVKVSTEFVAYEALHDKIVAAAPAGTYDLVFIDVIWPAEFATKGLIADISNRIPDSWNNDVLKGALDSAVFQGKYYGVPWLLDAKFFYYNKDLLTKAGVDPASVGTWDGVATAAKAIKEKAGVQFPLMWSWAQAEAVICDWALMTASFGGTLFDDKGQPAFTEGGAVQALEFMRKTIVDGVTNPSSTQSLEDDVVKVFGAGDAAMGLNWSYMFAAVNDPKQSKVPGQAVVTEVPDGGSGRISVNGSSALAITATSKNADAAWEFAKYVSSYDVQNKYISDALPIWKKAYDDPTVIATAPEFVPVAQKQFDNMTGRPAVVAYNAVSQKLQVAVQKALLGDVTPQQAMDGVKPDVEKLLAQ
jgi:multiple sugar transport system substrate-binding protein